MGNLTSPLIKLNGADYIVFDGLNTGGSSLTVENTSIATDAGFLFGHNNGIVFFHPDSVKTTKTGAKSVKEATAE
ncbi:MAG: hypothetical protein HGA25_04490 [Clostridiales bacterium]|nr:hypothetical protein [Clostridiales bacterium]